MKHEYRIKVEWTGNSGSGTKDYRSYKRDHLISAEEKYDQLMVSSDPAFMGDRTRYNPEELFLSSISSCHMLWYLHLCSSQKIVITDYEDKAYGVMEESSDGSGRFTQVILNPVVTIEDEKKMDLAASLHKKANEMCFIANSCNFIIEHNPTIIIEGQNE